MKYQFCCNFFVTNEQEENDYRKKFPISSNNNFFPSIFLLYYCTCYSTTMNSIHHSLHSLSLAEVQHKENTSFILLCTTFNSVYTTIFYLAIFLLSISFNFSLFFLSFKTLMEVQFSIFSFR
jgi:hypothetical protein